MISPDRKAMSDRALERDPRTTGAQNDTPLPPDGAAPGPAPSAPSAPSASIASTEPAARSTPTEDRSPDDDHDTKFSLSATQIVASTAAAVTAALIGSHLGVAGTLVGAAIASIVSGVGAAIYGHSLIVTRRGVRKAYLLVRPVQDAAGIADSTDALSAARQRPASSRPAWVAASRNHRYLPSLRGREDVRATGSPGWYQPTDDAGATTVMPAVSLGAGSSRPGSPPTRSPRPAFPRTRSDQPVASRPRSRRGLMTGVLAGAAAAAVIFGASLAAVTVVETVKGSPLSGGDSGLSILGGQNGSDPLSPSVDPPAVTAPTGSDSTAASTVTQTVTQGTTAASRKVSGSSGAAQTSATSAVTGSSSAPAPSATPTPTPTPAPAASASAATGAPSVTPVPDAVTGG